MASHEEIIFSQKQSWNTFSGGWQKWDPFIQNWLGPVGDAINQKASLKAGDRVLDAATGTGEPGLSAAKIVGAGEVVGTDVAEEMVHFARGNAKKQGIANFSAVVAATSKLSFKDNSFDAAISRFGVIFAPDVLSDIRELMRVVKPGGKISAGVWAEPVKNPWATIIPKMIQEIMHLPPLPAGAPGIFRCAEPNSLPNIMTEAGLRDVGKIEVRGGFVADSPEQYWNFMTEVAAPVAGALSGADDTVRGQIHKKTL